MGSNTTSAAAVSSGSQSADARRLLDRELDSGERVRWSGQPLPNKLAKKSMVVFLFAIPWTAFSVFWTVMATWGAGAFGLFGVPFLLIGVFMLTTPWRTARAARRTVYAITDRRALVIAPTTTTLMGNELTVATYMPAQLQSLTRNEASDGSGDLIFVTIRTTTSKGGTRTEHNGFLAVADVHQVERTLKRELLEPALVASSVSSVSSSAEAF